MIVWRFDYVGLCQLRNMFCKVAYKSFVRSWQKAMRSKRPAIIVIHSARYLLTISLPVTKEHLRKGVWSTKNTLPVRQLTLGYLSTYCKQQQVMTEEDALPSSGWGWQGCTGPCWLGRPTLGQWQKYPKMWERQTEGVSEIHTTWAAWIRIEALARKLQNTHKNMFMDSCNSTAQKDRA